jgi:hypothetical protein
MHKIALSTFLMRKTKYKTIPVSNFAANDKFLRKGNVWFISSYKLNGTQFDDFTIKGYNSKSNEQNKKTNLISDY